MSKKYNFIKEAIVDTKEQKMKKITSQYLEKRKIKVKEDSNLDGDVIFVLNDGTKIYVERKGQDDYPGSYVENHLQDQSIRLGQYDYAIIIYYGDFNNMKKSHNPKLKYFKKESLTKIDITMSLFYPTPVIYAGKTETDYLKALLLVPEIINKNKNKELSATKKVKHVQKERPDISLLCSLGGIGPSKAELLLDEFNTVNAVFEALDEEILNIKNSGPDLLKKVRELQNIFENGVK